MTEEKHIQILEDRGLLPPKEVYDRKATPGQEFHSENTKELVVFVHHFRCGFGVHPSAFLEHICDFYNFETHLLGDLVIVPFQPGPLLL